MILSWVHSVSFYKEHLYKEQYSKIKWTKETSTSCFEDKDKMRKKKSESQIFLKFSLFAIFWRFLRNKHHVSDSYGTWILKNLEIFMNAQYWKFITVPCKEILHVNKINIYLSSKFEENMISYQTLWCIWKVFSKRFSSMHQRLKLKLK